MFSAYGWTGRQSSGGIVQISDLERLYESLPLRIEQVEPFKGNRTFGLSGHDQHRADFGIVSAVRFELLQLNHKKIGDECVRQCG